MAKPVMANWRQLYEAEQAAHAATERKRRATMQILSDTQDTLALANAAIDTSNTLMAAATPAPGDETAWATARTANADAMTANSDVLARRAPL